MRSRNSRTRSSSGGSLDQTKLSSRYTSHPSRRSACAYCMYAQK